MILRDPAVRTAGSARALPGGHSGSVDSDYFRDLGGATKLCDDSRCGLHPENVAIITTAFKNNCSEFDNGRAVALYATLCRWSRTSRAGSAEPSNTPIFRRRGSRVRFRHNCPAILIAPR